MLSLLSAGSNAQGQLGNTTTDDSHVFQTCSFFNLPPGGLPSQATHVLDIANGANHTLLLLRVRVTDDEESATEIWGCGDGRAGQLGPNLQQQEPITVFHKLGLEGPLSELSPGKYTIKSTGATWETSYLVVARHDAHDAIISFGSNDFGDLGVGRDAGVKAAGKGSEVHIVDFSHVLVAGKLINSAKAINIGKAVDGTETCHCIAESDLGFMVSCET